MSSHGRHGLMIVSMKEAGIACSDVDVLQNVCRYSVRVDVCWRRLFWLTVLLLRGMDVMGFWLIIGHLMHSLKSWRRNDSASIALYDVASHWNGLRRGRVYEPKSIWTLVDVYPRVRVPAYPVRCRRPSCPDALRRLHRIANRWNSHGHHLAVHPMAGVRKTDRRREGPAVQQPSRQDGQSTKLFDLLYLWFYRCFRGWPCSSSARWKMRSVWAHHDS